MVGGGQGSLMAVGQEPWPGWSDARDEPPQLKQLQELMLVPDQSGWTLTSAHH